jgi:hypothetical protein
MDLVADTDIEWDILQARFQYVWSTTALRRKWAHLKSSVDNFRNKAHQGLLNLSIDMTLGLFEVEPRYHHSPSHTIFFPNMMSDVSGRKLGNNTGLAGYRKPPSRLLLRPLPMIGVIVLV